MGQVWDLLVIRGREKKISEKHAPEEVQAIEQQNRRYPCSPLVLRLWRGCAACVISL